MIAPPDTCHLECVILHCRVPNLDMGVTLPYIREARVVLAVNGVAMATEKMLYLSRMSSGQGVGHLYDCDCWCGESHVGGRSLPMDISFHFAVELDVQPGQVLEIAVFSSEPNPGFKYGAEYRFDYRTKPEDSDGLRRLPPVTEAIQ